MATICQNIGHVFDPPAAVATYWELVLAVLLLVCSAFFSSSETAFFNVSRRQVNLMRKSEHKLQNLCARMLSRPGQLLSCLLFGNMIVNVLFYAVASILVLNVKQQIGLTPAAITAFFSFALLVVFGEIVPKSVAYTKSGSLSVIFAAPAFVVLQVFKPVVATFRLLIVEPVLRLVLGPARQVKPITAEEFKLLIEQMHKRGLITPAENKLVSEIIELGILKVRHVMQPRVDMTFCAVTDSAKKVTDTMRQSRLTKLPVYADKVDNIVGLVHLRQILLDPKASIDKFVEKVHFVPEQKSVESLLEFFRKTETDTAIVVDEYGGLAGLVRLKDIAEELLGVVEFTDGTVPIEQTGPFEYRLGGNLPIHDWADSFGLDLADTRISTIAGLVTALLGKIPQSGDVARLQNLKFTVEKVQKHRIRTVILSLEAIGSDS